MLHCQSFTASCLQVQLVWEPFCLRLGWVEVMWLTRLFKNTPFLCLNKLWGGPCFGSWSICLLKRHPDGLYRLQNSSCLKITENMMTEIKKAGTAIVRWWWWCHESSFFKKWSLQGSKAAAEETLPDLTVCRLSAAIHPSRWAHVCVCVCWKPRLKALAHDTYGASPCAVLCFQLAVYRNVPKYEYI